MKVVAIIPARGGSKGIPKKNLKKIGGLTLVERAVKSALSSRLIESVYVTTDSDEIASNAASAGAKVIMRPRELATDESSSESALLHAVESEEQIRKAEVILFLQCTSPFIFADDMDNAVKTVLNKEADSVFSGIPDNAFRWILGEQGLKPLGHDQNSRRRRQELDSTFLETGAFYAFTPSGLVNSGSRFHGKVAVIEVSSAWSVDIDTVEDFSRARALFLLLQQKSIAKKISAVVLDFDGVHTDDSVWVDQNGIESVRVSRSDGHGISLLKSRGIRVLILSAEENPVVLRRSEKLGVECINGVGNKLMELKKWAGERSLPLTEIAYVGNDTNDLECMNAVGLGICVADAHPLALQSADVVLTRDGGSGAVREMADLLEKSLVKSTEETE